MGLTVRRFEFTFPNLENSLKNLKEPSSGLINKNTGIEENSSVLTQASFFPEQKTTEEAIKNHNNVTMSYYINESYFLRDKSDLIKETFITALNKIVSIYGSVSYFNKKTENEIFKRITPENLLKFYVEKDATKNFLRFQITNISGELPKVKDKIIYNLSLTRIEEKRKRQMAEPIETLLIRAQQSFEIAGGLNPVQIEIDDDKILNILKKYKNVRHRLTPLGLLFPASIKNDI